MQCPAKAIKALFKKYDVEGKGLISRKRVTRLLKHLATELSDREIEFVLATVAQDGELTLSYDKFVDWVMDVHSESELKADIIDSNVETVEIVMPTKECDEPEPPNCQLNVETVEIAMPTKECDKPEPPNRQLKAHIIDTKVETVEIAAHEPEPPRPTNNLPPIVTATRTKWELGKEVVAEIPHSEGPPLNGFCGLIGIVQDSEMTPDGRVYEVKFDMRRQVRIGSAVLVQGRTGKIIYGPDEDQEYIVRFDDDGTSSDCLKKEDFTFPEGGDDTCSAKIPAEYLRTAGVMVKSTNVQFLTIDDVLRECKLHTIPVFQRRYCWTERQCSRLWQSIETMRHADSDSNNHSIGRLMLLEQSGSRLVLDGQQRLTTLTLFFAALRDRLTELGGGKAVAKAAAELGRLCVGRLVPTLDDRPDFERCLTEPEPAGDGALLTAKRVLVRLAKSLDVQGCKDMAKTARKRLAAIAFVLKDERSVQRVYENLAKRNVALEEARRMGVDLSTCTECFLEDKQVPSTHWGPDGERLCECHAVAKGLQNCESMTPGVEMSPADLIRNFVIEHCKDEPTMRKVHADYWSPLEARAGGTAEGLERTLATFLAEQGFKLKSRWQLYSIFVAWWQNGAATDCSVEEYAKARLGEILAAQSLALPCSGP
eukprot:gnl/MRDRNA2_/MRDRNA2_127876_c0_seq1.p1 gnl/MRDRNA2_/MRDRNA2_127876_c0~~gnl/MRDRNA2_/MRDRNA2_127876_c0_seq1.p1  ORF type:complete len:653 (+),score=117.85 gnl/MRDRNA2_/MRDRNA2_127876_c0_seq1:77-2035(+)